MIPDALFALALVCALVPFAACVTAGAAIAPGRLWPGADMIVGFGAFSVVLTGLAVTTRVPLSWLMGGLLLLSVIVVAVRRKIPGGYATWIALALISPLLVKAAGHVPAMWDDFWNWQPSTIYEFQHNSLPWPDLAKSFSIFPGYPQGIPLLAAAVSMVRGRYLEAGGPLVNVLLLAGSAAFLAEALAAALVRRGRLQAMETPVALVAGAVAITVLLNPGLDGAVVLSTYADCGTMVAVGALGLLAVEILARLSASERGNAEALAWRFGLVGAMLVNLKQANPVLLALVTAGLVVVVIRHPPMRTWRAAMLLARMLLPAIVVMVAWRWYVAFNLTDAEKSFQPFAQWNFPHMGQTFKSIGYTILNAPAFNGLMWLVTAAGVVAFFQLPRKVSEARWLAVIFATVWLGYNAFLLLIYLAVMSVYEAQTAADYWRYMPHTALLGLYAPVLALVCARWPAWLKPRGVAVTAVLVVLALGALPLRSDFNNPSGRDRQQFLRNVAGEMRRIIPAAAKVMIVPCYNSSPFGVAVRYNLWRPNVPEAPIDATILWNGDNLVHFSSWVGRSEGDYLILHDAEKNMNEATDAIGLSRIHHEVALFAWRNGKWEKAKSWPIPPALMEY